MPAGEIAKRLTLHDLFGFMLPGSVYVIGTAAGVLVLAPDPDNDWLVRFMDLRYGRLDLTARIVAFVVAVYAVGLLAIGVGEVLYRCVWDPATRRWLGPGLRRLRHGWLLPAQLSEWGWRVGHRDRDVIWEDDERPPSPSGPPAEPARGEPPHPLRLPEPLRERLRERVREAAGLPADAAVPDRAVRSFAYAWLIQTGRDRFIQLMSSRAFMFQGLAGSVSLVLASLAFYVLRSWWVSTGILDRWVRIAGIAGLGLGLVFWCLFNVWWYKVWYHHHVVYGFLAASAVAQGEHAAPAGDAAEHD